MDRLHIANEMREFDCKNREFYDELTDEERRRFSPYLMIRWGSSVEGNADLQEYYLLSTNKRLNHGFFSINASRHKKLLWLMATTVSPDVGAVRHRWIAPRKSRSKGSQHRRTMCELFPHLRDDEIDLMISLNSEQVVAEYLRELGQ